MGCYMSKPDDKVYLTEGSGKNFYYATASCQGWRREQEDAEACLPYFDEDASLFVLCDGHGGAEVAKYTVEHYPNFLKNHKLYKEQDFEQALRESFKEFDALLRTDEVLDELNKIALDEKCKKYDDNANDDEMEGVKTENSEGETPSDGPSTSSGAGPSCAGPSGSSSSCSSSSNNRPTTEADDIDYETLRREAQMPIEVLRHKYSAPKSQSGAQASLHEGGDQDEDKPQASSSSASSTAIAPEDVREIMKKAIAQYFDVDDDEDDNSEDDSEFDGENSSGSNDEKESDDDDDDDDEDDEDEDDEDDNDDDEDGDDERDDEASAKDDENKNLRRKKFKKRRRSKESSPNDSSSENDEDDDDDDDDDDDEDGSEDEEEGDDVPDEEDESSSSEPGEEPAWYSLRNMNQKLKAATRVHRPGIDSGCTVVVALLKGKTLYVASAGDSRCIVIMRDGQFRPMSIDHKPEDYIEYKRITSAGGRVTEGRVNGGLNLSRAFGDFTYKDQSLEAENQMITPCPDIRVTDVDPERVEYIFLACDGIWNSMKNQQVTKFIRKLAPSVKNNLVELCLGLFKNCIAPGTDGDGTGCDNMTCILARFIGSGEEIEQSDLKETTTTLSETTIPTSAATTTTSETKDSSSTGEQETTTETSTSPASKRKRARDALDEERKRICLRIQNSGGY